MLDDFLARALLAGIGAALIAGPLGCLIFWRRMAYFGDAMAHTALLGVALGLLLHITPVLAVFLTCGAVVLALLGLHRNPALSSDSLLGILAHGALAFGVILLALGERGNVDLMGYLFGDILAISTSDLALIWLGGLVMLLLLWEIWDSLLVAAINRDLAAAEGFPLARNELVFMLLLAGLTAVAMKIIGVMLITALLIIPAATARNLARTPEKMAFWAAAFGILAVMLGLGGSWQYDTPAGPSIVGAAFLCFALTTAISGAARTIRRAKS